METKTKGLTICKVCGIDFPLIIKNHYVSIEEKREGLIAAVGGTSPQLYDTFDCPFCGCQNRMQRRNRITDIFGSNLSADDCVKEKNSCAEKTCRCKDSETGLS